MKTNSCVILVLGLSHRRVTDEGSKVIDHNRVNYHVKNIFVASGHHFELFRN